MARGSLACRASSCGGAVVRWLGLASRGSGFGWGHGSRTSCPGLGHDPDSRLGRLAPRGEAAADPARTCVSVGSNGRVVALKRLRSKRRKGPFARSVGASWDNGHRGPEAKPRGPEAGPPDGWIQYSRRPPRVAELSCAALFGRVIGDRMGALVFLLRASLLRCLATPLKE